VEILIRQMTNFTFSKESIKHTSRRMVLSANRVLAVSVILFLIVSCGGEKVNTIDGDGTLAGNDTASPSIPTGLTSTVITAARVGLSWIASTDNVGVNGYRVYRDGIALGTTANAAYSDTSVLPSTSYDYVVLAYDAAGNESAGSAIYTATTSALPPSGNALYVAPPPTGNDGNNGSQGQPWATLQYAADNISPGDTVFVADGSYTGFIVSMTGQLNNRITFFALGNSAVIDKDIPANGDGIRLENVSYVTIEGFTINGVTNRGIAHRGATATSPVNGLIIRGNTIQNSGLFGLYLSQVANSTIENNVISGTSGGSSTTGHGFYLANAGSDSNVIKQNTIFNNGNEGMHLNGDQSVGGDGLISNLLIERNYIYGNAKNGINMDGVNDSVIRNNVIYNNGRSGIRSYKIDGAKGSAGLAIYNNTIHVLSGQNWGIKITEDEGQNVAFNNILINENGGTGSISLDATKGFSSSNNAVINSFSTDRDATILSLSQWQSAGYGTNSFLATAAGLFVSPGTNYQLQSGTSAVDSGVISYMSYSAPTIDILGNPRPAGAGVDIGAYECAAC